MRSFLLYVFVAFAAAANPVRLCQGPVCSKNGAATLLSSCKAIKGLEVKGVSQCLKVCAKDKVVCSGKGLGKKTFNAKSPGDAKASAQAIAKKMGA